MKFPKTGVPKIIQGKKHRPWLSIDPHGDLGIPNFEKPPYKISSTYYQIDRFTRVRMTTVLPGVVSYDPGPARAATPVSAWGPATEAMLFWARWRITWAKYGDVFMKPSPNEGFKQQMWGEYEN